MSNLSYNSIEQKENSLSGKFLYISESAYDTDWRSYPHQHFCAEIFFVKSGSGEFQIGKSRFKAQKDTIVIVNSNLQHTEYSTSDDPMSYYVIGIEDLDFTFTKSQKKYGVINNKELAEDARIIMGRMIEENQNQKPQYSIACKKLAEIFIISLQRQEDIKVMFTDVYNISKECLIAKEYIDNNYSLNIDLDILAEQAHLSRFYLSRKFSEEFGVSPMQYLTEKRLQVADQLLSYTNFTIAQIAESIGYSSQSYFAQVYKKNKWVSPVEYRKNELVTIRRKKLNTNTNELKTALEIAKQFRFEGEILDCALYGGGHINVTFKIETSRKKYILQKVNTLIFKDPVGMMNNILGVTGFLKEKVVKAGKDPDKFSLYVIKTKNNEDYINDELGFWRAYNFIDNAISLDQIENSSQFYNSGLGFGSFQYLLNDYPADSLGETIKDFHNTPLRFEAFKNMVSKDPLNRVKDVKKEIEFYMDRADFYPTLIKQQASGILPLRVTHNDTKSNNVMLDNKSLEPLCVVDLDTVMPGLSAYDFGDSIRFGASTAAEDEPDIEKVTLSLDYYKAFTDGFCKGLNNSLSKDEIKAFSVGAQMMTAECGMRFLTDYIAGDVYFKISREQQNLDRSRTQIKLFEEMSKYKNKIEDIINVYI